MWMALWGIHMFVALILIVLGLIIGVVTLLTGLLESFLARCWWLLLGIGIVGEIVANIGERIARKESKK